MGWHERSVISELSSDEEEARSSLFPVNEIAYSLSPIFGLAFAHSLSPIFGFALIVLILTMEEQTLEVQLQIEPSLLS